MRNVYIDFSLLAYRNLFSMTPIIKQYGYDILRHVMLKSILAQVRNLKAQRVYIAFDTGKSWRKEYSALYKAQRKGEREKHSVKSGGDVDWPEFYKLMDSIKQELKEYFPFFVYSIPHLEADDIIAYLVKYSDPDDKKIIVTSDRDYVQLMQYPNTEIHDPIKGQRIKCKNPMHQLQVKICMGDKSDNIPAIRPRCGEKTAEKMILSGELDKLLKEKDKDGKPTELVKNYKINTKLIDLKLTPSSLLKKLEDQIDSYDLGTGKKIFEYFMNNNLNELMKDVSTIRNTLTKLHKNSFETV